MRLLGEEERKYKYQYGPVRDISAIKKDVRTVLYMHMYSTEWDFKAVEIISTDL